MSNDEKHATGQSAGITCSAARETQTLNALKSEVLRDSSLLHYTERKAQALGITFDEYLLRVVRAGELLIFG